MKKIRLENVDIDLKEKLKNEEFRRLYEFESAKVALAQKIAEMRQDGHLKQVDLAKEIRCFSAVCFPNRDRGRKKLNYRNFNKNSPIFRQRY